MGHSRLSSAYPPQLADEEARQIQRRRDAVRGQGRGGAAAIPAGEKPPQPDNVVGVALSGGGIRSATFCLGVFRALARQDRIGRVDLLSTVSGGGYFGSFLGGLFVPRHRPSPPPSVEDVSATLLDLRSQPVDWLRENGRYMSPNGAGDMLLAGATLLRNWIAVVFVVASFLFTAFAGTCWLSPKLQAWWGAARGSRWLTDIDRAMPWAALSAGAGRALPQPLPGAARGAALPHDHPAGLGLLVHPGLRLQRPSGEVPALPLRRHPGGSGAAPRPASAPSGVSCWPSRAWQRSPAG